MRVYITKSKSGHYTATIRDERGMLVHVDRGLATLGDARHAARAALAKATAVIGRAEANTVVCRELLAEMDHPPVSD